MQSETADFVTSAATWRSVPNILSSFILVYYLHYMKTWRHPQNRKYNNVLHCCQSGSITTATGNIGPIPKNLVKYACVIFEIRKRTDKQTNGQTDTLTTMPRTPTGAMQQGIRRRILRPRLVITPPATPPNQIVCCHFFLHHPIHCCRYQIAKVYYNWPLWTEQKGSTD